MVTWNENVPSAPCGLLLRDPIDCSIAGWFLLVDCGHSLAQSGWCLPPPKHMLCGHEVLARRAFEFPVLAEFSCILEESMFSLLGLPLYLCPCSFYL